MLPTYCCLINPIYIYIYIYIYMLYHRVESILLYGCTTWTLTKRMEKKLDGNYTRMQRAILNKFWNQHPTQHHLYVHLTPITKTIKVRRTRKAIHCRRSRDDLISDVLQWPSDQLEHTYSSSVRIRYVALRTSQKRWTIVRSGEKGSGIPVLVAQYDNDDDDDWFGALSNHPAILGAPLTHQLSWWESLTSSIYIYIYIYIWKSYIQLPMTNLEHIGSQLVLKRWNESFCYVARAEV